MNVLERVHAHLEQYDISQDVRELEAAVRLLRGAMETAGEEERADRAGDLGAALRRLQRHTGEVRLLDEAITLLGVALSGGFAEFDHCLSLVCALQDRSEIDGDVARLDEAIAIAQAVLEGPLEDEERAELSSALSTLLQDRYEADSDQTALLASIEPAKLAVELTAPDHPRAGAYLGHLGLALRMAYETSGKDGLLNDAIEASRAAVRTSEGNDHGQGIALANLATALRFLHERTGSVPVLEEAIRSVRRAIALTENTHLNQASYRSNLSLLLWTRHERVNDLDTLIEAIEHGREAVARTSPTTVDHSRYSLNLALVLWTRHDRDPRTSDLNEAIRFLRGAVSGIDPHQTLFPICASNLSLALRSRFLRGGDTADLDEALTVAEQVLRYTGDDHVEQARHMSNVGALYVDRYRYARAAAPRAGEAEDLAQAIDRFRDALGITSEDHQNHALYSFNLGEAIHLRSVHRGPSQPGGKDLEEARKFLRTAAESSQAPVLLQVEAAQLAGRMAADNGDWAAATELLSLGVRLLPRVAPRHLGLHDRGRALSGFLGLASDAAAAALHRNDPRLALSLLEQGRGILLNRLLRNDPDLERLRAEYPKLASEYEWLRDVLDQHGSADQAPSSGGHDDAHLSFARWEELVEQIRALPGMERFSLGPTTEQLVGLAKGRVLVIVNSSRYRCDALVVTDEGLDCRPLPSLDMDAIIRWVRRVQEAVTEVRDGSGRRRALGERRFTVMFEELSSWLWQNVVGPVVEPLPDTARVVWSPTGMLTALPLHAAGRAEPGDLLDTVVSSYTPTLRALGLPRRSCPQRVSAEQLLLVSAASDLRTADTEARTVADLLGVGEPLVGEKARKQLVVGSLPEAVVAHLAVHGISEPSAPTRSCLELADDVLELAEIARVRAGQGWLAYLSACDTAEPSEMLSDEALHLAAAFLASGFPHVIATLWPAEDESATSVAQNFYQEGVPVDPAAALNRSLRTLRRKIPESPFRWGAYQHWGDSR